MTRPTIINRLFRWIPMRNRQLERLLLRIGDMAVVGNALYKCVYRNIGKRRISMEFIGWFPPDPTVTEENTDESIS